MEKSTFQARPTCLECRFSDKHIQENHNIVTICRFNPPVLGYGFVLTAPDQGRIMHQSIWPEMRAGDWCGKLETRTN